jgi:hypothetical protein
LYSDYRVLIDDKPKGKIRTNLYIYNFVNKEQNIVNTNIDTDFNAKWINNDSIEYYSTKAQNAIKEYIKY